MRGVPVAQRGAVFHAAPVAPYGRGAGQADQLTHAPRIESLQLCHRHRRADHTVSAVRMNFHAHVTAAAYTAANFVTERAGQQQLLARAAQLLRRRQRGGNHLYARMAVGGEIALIELKPAAGGGVERRRVHGVQALTRTKHAGKSGRHLRQLLFQQSLHFRLAVAGGAGGERVSDDGTQVIECRGRNVGQLRAVGKVCQLVQIGRRVAAHAPLRCVQTAIAKIKR